MTAPSWLPAPVLRALTSPILMVLGAVVSVQVGAGIAKGGFEAVGATGLVLLRLAVAALVLLVAVRPRLRGRGAAAWRTAVGFGASLGVMNWAIYQSFARIELGIAVTIEFLGPLTVAVVMSRRPRDLVWAALAGLGVVALGVGPSSLDPLGVGFALVAAAAWAAYIFASAGTGRHWEGIDGLAVASTIAALLVAPAMLLPQAAGGFSDGTPYSALLTPAVLVAGVAAGLLSSVVPYALELLALRSLSPRTFGVLLSLEPAAAAAVGAVLLSERLGLIGWLAIGAVVVASIGATRSRAEAEAVDRTRAPAARGPRRGLRRVLRRPHDAAAEDEVQTGRLG